MGETAKSPAITAGPSGSHLADSLAMRAAYAARGRRAPLLLLLLALALGGGLYSLDQLQRAEARQAAASARAALLDREISSRIYQWIHRGRSFEAGLAFDRSSAALGLYRLLLAPPLAEAGEALLPTVEELRERGLVSLVLELSELVEGSDGGRIAAVGSLIVQPDQLLSACATPRECTGSVAMSILLDRWRQ